MSPSVEKVYNRMTDAIGRLTAEETAELSAAIFSEGSVTHDTASAFAEQFGTASDVEDLVSKLEAWLEKQG